MRGPAIARLRSPVQHYAWGSRKAIARLQGRPTPSAEPEAELWMGAHPLAPSRVLTDGEPSLREHIAADPDYCLGHMAVERFGPELPFLLKVLAAAEPLSLQAHPSRAQAEAGFAREEAEEIPLDAPRRSYKDPNHKPELICALEPFDALCGFRPPGETLALVAALGEPVLGDALAALEADPDATGLRRAVADLLAAPEEERRKLLAGLRRGCRRLQATGQPASWVAACRWILELERRYPEDPGVALALLLNHLRLECGEGLYLAAGNLHSYLGGLGVEIMASSDNVLRAGCTVKHVDRPELLRILDTRPLAPEPLGPQAASDREAVYPTPAPEFRLSRLRPSAEPLELATWGPEILLVVEGEAELRQSGGSPVALARGESAFVAAAADAYTVSGTGTLFRATVNR